MHGELAAGDVKVYFTLDPLELFMLQRLVYGLQGVRGAGDEEDTLEVGFVLLITLGRLFLQAFEHAPVCFKHQFLLEF